MPIRLNETAIAKAIREVSQSKKRRDISDEGFAGLRLRITPNVQSWVLACRDRAGAMRRFPLGTYPTMGVADAREAARQLHHKVKHAGADPIKEARQERSQASDARHGIGTLAAILDIYGERKGNQLKSWADSRKRVEVVFKPLLDKAVASMTIGDLQLVADAYPFPQSASFAVRSLRPALKWASQPGRAYLAKALTEITQPMPPIARQRTLSRGELASILPVLRQSTRPHAKAMLFILLTLARREEVCDATWREIDLSAGTWTLPGSRTKNGQPHNVPLSRQAISLLRDIGPGEADAVVFATSQHASLGNWDREQKRIHTKSKTTDWHRHDLRRTGATLIGEMGVPPHIVEAALNHVAIHSTLAATYNRYRYGQEVADALQRLGDLLDGIEKGAHIVQLHVNSVA
jgi:integrase